MNQLLSGAIPLGRGVFGDPTLPTLISGVSCNGSEFKLLECLSNRNALSTCGAFNDVAVVCQSKWPFSGVFVSTYVHKVTFYFRLLNR